MSRIGKHPVPLPAGVTAEVKGQNVSVKGKLGNLALAVNDNVTVTLEDGRVVLQPRTDSKLSRMNWGTARTLVNNMVKGVSVGFTETLEINGVGFRAAVTGSELVLQLGFSHEVKYPIPEGVTMKVEKQTVISITGIDKQQIGQIAAEIRGTKPPEPYKGKGIKYASETVRRKEGKKK
jgi:large subunit ribosomal protein L6